MSSKLFRRLAIVAGLAAASLSFSQAQVYMVAHADDWPLFMGHKAYEDVSMNRQAVFIYTTSGDAGMRTGGWGSLPYYRAREEATIHTLRLPTTQVLQWYPADVTARVKVNNRNITTITHRNTISYFLRLPDGSPSGAGFEINGFQSLERFRDGKFTNLKAIDGSATYAKWSDLVATVKAIFLRHGTGQTINTHDFDETFNVGTHSDHSRTGFLARDASVGVSSMNRYWVDYETHFKEPNLTQEQTFDKHAMYGAHMATLSRYGYNFGYDAGHKAWLSRGFYREAWN